MTPTQKLALILRNQNPELTYRQALRRAMHLMEISKTVNVSRTQG